MIKLEELQKKISNILNNIDTETMSYDNPCDDFYFAVKTYGTRLETIGNETLKRNIIPVYINLSNSNVEPIEDLGEIDTTFDFYIYFPLKYKEQFFQLGSFLLNCFNAKTLNYGNESGKALTTLSLPELNEIEDLQLNELGSFLEQDFNLPIRKTEQYGVLTFNIYFYQVANLGNDNGFILGNEVKYYFTYKGLTEEIIATQRIINYEGDTYTEQNFAESETGAIVKNGITTWTINPYVRNNDFWKTFLYDFENGDLYNQTCILKTEYPYGTYQRELLILSCVSADSIGEIKVCTITLGKKIGVSSSIVVYYNLTLKYLINGEEDTSLTTTNQIESGTRIYPSSYYKNITNYMVESCNPSSSFSMNSDNTIYYYYVDAVLSDAEISNGIMHYQGDIISTLAVPVITEGVLHYIGELPTYIETLNLSVSSNTLSTTGSITYDISYTPTDALTDLDISINNSNFVIDKDNQTITCKVADLTGKLTVKDSYTALSKSVYITTEAAKLETPTLTLSGWNQGAIYYTLYVKVFTRSSSESSSYSLNSTYGEQHQIRQGTSVALANYAPSITGYVLDRYSGTEGSMESNKTFYYYYTYTTYTLTTVVYTGTDTYGTWDTYSTSTSQVPYNTYVTSSYNAPSMSGYDLYQAPSSFYMTSDKTRYYYYLEEELLTAPEVQTYGAVDNGDGTYTIQNLVIGNDNSVAVTAIYTIGVKSSGGSGSTIDSGSFSISANGSYSGDITFTCDDYESGTLTVYFAASGYTNSRKTTVDL